MLSLCLQVVREKTGGRTRRARKCGLLDCRGVEDHVSGKSLYSFRCSCDASPASLASLVRSALQFGDQSQTRAPRCHAKGHADQPSWIPQLWLHHRDSQDVQENGEPSRKSTRFGRKGNAEGSTSAQRSPDSSEAACWLKLRELSTRLVMAERRPRPKEGR